MARKNTKSLQQQAETIRAETAANANTADRVGSALRDLLDSTVTEYDPQVVYTPNMRCIWGNLLYKTPTGAGPNQSPDSHPQRWETDLVRQKDLITRQGPEAPVSARALAELVVELFSALQQNTGVLPDADEDTPGAARRARLEEVLAGIANNAFVTPALLSRWKEEYLPEAIGLKAVLNIDAVGDRPVTLPEVVLQGLGGLLRQRITQNGTPVDVWQLGLDTTGRPRFGMTTHGYVVLGDRLLLDGRATVSNLPAGEALSFVVAQNTPEGADLFQTSRVAVAAALRPLLGTPGGGSSVTETTTLPGDLLRIGLFTQEPGVRQLFLDTTATDYEVWVERVGAAVQPAGGSGSEEWGPMLWLPTFSDGVTAPYKRRRPLNSRQGTEGLLAGVQYLVKLRRTSVPGAVYVRLITIPEAPTGTIVTIVVNGSSSGPQFPVVNPEVVWPDLVAVVGQDPVFFDLLKSGITDPDGNFSTDEWLALGLTPGVTLDSQTDTFLRFRVGPTVSYFGIVTVRRRGADGLSADRAFNVRINPAGSGPANDLRIDAVFFANTETVPGSARAFFTLYSGQPDIGPYTVRAYNALTGALVREYNALEDDPGAGIRPYTDVPYTVPTFYVEIQGEGKPEFFVRSNPITNLSPPTPTPVTEVIDRVDFELVNGVPDRLYVRIKMNPATALAQLHYGYPTDPVPANGDFSDCLTALPDGRLPGDCTQFYAVAGTINDGRRISVRPKNNPAAVLYLTLPIVDSTTPWTQVYPSGPPSDSFTSLYTDLGPAASPDFTLAIEDATSFPGQ